MRKIKFIKILFLATFIFSCNFLIAQDTVQDYESVIEMGDKYFHNNDYINAKASYTYAIKLIPEKEYPNTKLNETLQLLRSQMVLKRSYAVEVTQADVFLEGKKYQEAILKYQDAQKILSSEIYPKSQIDYINKLLADEKARKENFQKAVINGNNYFDQKEYEKALNEFLTAIKLNPDAISLNEKIENIQSILSAFIENKNKYNIAISNAEFFSNKNELQKAINEYETASKLLSNESLPKNKIAELQRKIKLLNNYDELIKKADEYYVVKDFENAQKTYSEANQQYSGKAYPKDMLEKIKTALANKKTTKEQDYKNAIANGNANFDNENYKDAEIEFQFALRLKPDEIFPKEKLTEINEIILKIARGEKARKNYDDAILKAEEFYTINNYEEARKSFQNALTFMPEEKYPLEKITEINSILSEISNQETINKKFDDAIAKADEFLKNSDYENAKSKFLDARNIKPSEQYPKQKLDELNKILNEIEAKRSVEEKYNNSITNADNYFNNADYENALIEYKKAKSLKPEETYSDKQIITVNGKLKEIEAEKRKSYELLITDADSSFNTEEYPQAIEKYKNAKDLLPDEIYPQTKIDEANTIIATLRKAKQQKFDAAIAEANKYYKVKIYDRAIASYQQAFDLLPFEKYPKEMLDKINKTMEENVLVEVFSQDTIIKMNTKEKFVFDPVPSNKRKSNIILFRIKNLADKPIKAIMGYGSKNSKNGGSLIKLPVSKNAKDIFIRIGVQYKWFSEDNSWISLTPEGGDIEVSLIRISKGD